MMLTKSHFLVCLYIILLQPSWFVGLLCSLLPQPNQDGQVQGAPVDDGRLPQVNQDDGEVDYSDFGIDVVTTVVQLRIVDA